MLARILLFGTRFVVGIVKAAGPVLPYVVPAGFLKRRPDDFIHPPRLLLVGEMGRTLLRYGKVGEEDISVGVETTVTDAIAEPKLLGLV